MNKTKYSRCQLAAILFILAVFISCNNSNNIPFPENELGYTQPETQPLVFSGAKKLKWDTSKRGTITPLVKKLDINDLPAFPYDSTGFKSFSQPPEIVPFDINSLPGKDFSLDKLPEIPLHFTTSILGTPSITRAGTPVMQRGKPLSIFDFGIAQGMRGKLITSLLIDHNGLLWIGSSEGLFRYDGVNIQTFIQGSATSSPIVGITEDNEGNIWYIKNGGLGMINLHNGTISNSNKINFSLRGLDKMITDKKGNIWLYNSVDSAVNIIDPKALTFKSLDEKIDFSHSPNVSIIKFLNDDDNNIWITTTGPGVNIVNPVSGKIKYLGAMNGLGSDTVTSITKDKKGQIWVGVPNGLNAINVKKGTITFYGQLQGFKRTVLTSDLFSDEKGQIWKGTVSGIELANVEGGSTRNIDHNDGLIGDVVTSTVEDNYHRIWVATTNGLNMIDQYGETVHPLGTTQIVSLNEDGANNLWVATTTGLFIVNPQRSVMHLLDKAHGLSDNFVQSFWEKNGNIVVATDGGFNIFDPVRNTLTTVGKKEGLISDTVYTAFSASSGNMWLTGPSKGIFLLDSSKKMILHTDVDGGLSDDAILDIKQGNDGLIWLATQHNGIDLVNPVDGTVKYLNNQPGLKDTCSRMMLEDKYGRMWIGTDRGIYVTDTKNGTLTSITTKEGLSNNLILSLLEYSGTVLAGTNYKINMITPPGPGDSTGKWKISLLDKSQGLFREEANAWSTDGITHDGQYLWGDIGLTVIHQIKSSSDPVGSFITGINVMTYPRYFDDNNDIEKKRSNGSYIDDDKLRWNSVSGPYNLPTGLTLPYNKNYLQFQFAQASLGRPDTTLYTYILEGIDKRWSTPGINPFTENYLNLPPGMYTFKASSKGIDGKWGEPAIFKFTITPPWYQTWWAYTIYLLLGIGLLRLYVVYRSRQLKKENRILEEKVAHRTSQLKKSLEDLKATQSQLIQSEKMASLGELTAGIAHEIQNPLNFVNNFSEVNIELTDELKEELNKTKLSPEEKETIEKIADDIKSNQEKITFHGKRADSIVKGMLQHSRSSNGIKEPTDINALSDEYLRLAYHGLRARDKSFNATMNTEFDGSLPKINIVSQDIGRVILNLITNAFYAVTEKKRQVASAYEPTVTVSTGKKGDLIFVAVKDNGNGVPQKVMDKIFQPFFTTKPAGQGTGLGLSLSYDIVKAHGGELKVETKEGEGTIFTILLPK